MSSKVSPRLSEPLAPEILALIFAPRIQRELNLGIDDLCAVNEAHLVMLAKGGLIDPTKATSLARALFELRQAGAAAIEPDPAREDGYFNFEAALVARAGADAGGRLHVARSRNDMNAALDRIAARRHLIELAGTLIQVRQTLLARAQVFSGTIMPGYTHMQPAQPITFGFYLAGIAEALARDTDRLLAAYRAANASPLGACAFAGTSFPIDRALLARLLGFDDVRVHAQDAVTSRDYAWDIAAAVLSMASNWGRFAQDLYIWGTQEFGLVRFPDSIAGTSSIMPQKKNPVAVEYLKASAGEVVGGVTAIFAIVKGGHFSHAGDTGRSSLAPLWPVLRLTRDALAIAALVAGKVEPCADIMVAKAANGFSTATELADCLVREGGLSFREAHHVVAGLVRAALETGKRPDEVEPADLNEAIRSELKRAVSFDAGLVARALDPKWSVEKRRSLGAASPAETERMISAAFARLAADRVRLAEIEAGLQEADGLRASELQALRDGARS
jgi:argininosuccinate lyase